MDMSEKITVCAESAAQSDAAADFAERIGVSLSCAPGNGLTVFFGTPGVSLMGYGLTYHGDFELMLRRITGGRIHHEMLARAAKTKNPHPTAIDATAGMGEDALLLAACGYDVTMFEKDPVIAALLKDAMQRAKKCPELCGIIARMHLIEDDSTEAMSHMSEAPELIYLDPMFPERQKSGLINKKLQLIQKLERPCVDEDTLLSAALLANPRKIVIKRPLKGPYLANRTPSYSLKGKAIRYDCIVLR